MNILTILSILKGIAPVLKPLEEAGLAKLFVVMDEEAAKMGGDLGSLVRHILPGVKAFMTEELAKIQ